VLDLRERDHREDLGTEVKIILKLILKKEVGVWTVLTFLESGRVAGHCEQDKAHSGFIKRRKFLD
jgi:hypothetical protein